MSDMVRSKNVWKLFTVFHLCGYVVVIRPKESPLYAYHKLPRVTLL